MIISYVSPLSKIFLKTLVNKISSQKSRYNAQDLSHKKFEKQLISVKLNDTK